MESFAAQQRMQGRMRWTEPREDVEEKRSATKQGHS